eukprot:5981334-Alexandrium_andersonii.AAC.1
MWQRKALQSSWGPRSTRLVELSQEPVMIMGATAKEPRANISYPSPSTHGPIIQQCAMPTILWRPMALLSFASTCHAMAVSALVSCFSHALPYC